MSEAKLLSAFIALAVMGCWPCASAHAQGIEPVKKADTAAKAAKGQKGAPAQDASKAAKKDPEAAGRYLESGIKAYQAGKNQQAVSALGMAL